MNLPSLLLVLLLLLACCAAVPFRKVTLPDRLSRRRDELYGGLNTTMMYVVPLRLGTQWFLVQLDSGSAGTSVPVLGCEEGGAACVSASGGYLQSSCMGCSLAFRLAGRCDKVQGLGACAGHRLSYGDGSWLSGHLSEAEMQLGSLSSSLPFAFLAADQRHGFGSPLFDGIVGFAPAALDPLAGGDALLATGRGSFAFCGGRLGGRLVVSDDADELGRLGSGRLQWVPLLSLYSYYAVALQSVSLGTTTVAHQLSSYRTILDTGTTLVLLEQPLFAALAFAATDSYGSLYGFGRDGQPSVFGPFSSSNPRCLPAALFGDLRLYPDLVFTLGTVPLRLSASVYLLSMSEGSCLMLGIVSCSGCGVVLGDVFLSPFLAVFDRLSARAGFAPVAPACLVPPALFAGPLQGESVPPSAPLLAWTPLSVRGPSEGLSEWTVVGGSALLSRFVPFQDGVARNWVRPLNGTSLLLRVAADMSPPLLLSVAVAVEPASQTKVFGVVFGVAGGAVLLFGVALGVAAAVQLRQWRGGGY